MIGKEENDKMKSNRNHVEDTVENNLKETLLRERASVTLEAAIILPIFCFLFMALNGVFFVFSAQNQVMHTLVQTANSLSLDPYWNEKIRLENTSVSTILQRFERYAVRDILFLFYRGWK